MSHPTGPDRLRSLLDAVLAEDGAGLTDMARSAHASPFHFARQVSRGAGESPVALRRRVALERAAWRLRAGAGVTESAWEAGYDSVEGFARAYARAWGHPPSATPRGPAGSTAHWLPAPNGIHFHSPTALWVEAEPGSAPAPDGVSAVLAHHDVADLGRLLEAARGLPGSRWERVRAPGFTLLGWAGPEESVGTLLDRAVGTLETWLASIEGREDPPSADPRDPPAPEDVARRLDAVADPWLRLFDDVGRRGVWADRFVDALCEPPESFTLGGVLAHVITYNAARRTLARGLLRQDGVDVDDGDPILWLRGR